MSRNSALEELLPPAKTPDIFRHHKGRIARDQEQLRFNQDKRASSPKPSATSSHDSLAESFKAQSSSARALNQTRPAGEKYQGSKAKAQTSTKAQGDKRNHQQRSYQQHGDQKRSYQKRKPEAPRHHKKSNFRRSKTYQQGTGLTPQLKAIGLVTKAPETMVKIDRASHGIKTAHHLTEAGNYIARNGQMEVADQDGNLLSREEMRARMQAWADDMEMPTTDEDLQGKRAADARRLIVSCPAGTDPQKVWQTTQQFAQEMLKDNGFEYIMALHVKDEAHPNEPEHPHVHILIKAINNEGKRLNLRKDDLKFMRERFATLARRNGIAMNATPRAVRGQSERSKPIDRVYQEQRYFEDLAASQNTSTSKSATPSKSAGTNEHQAPEAAPSSSSEQSQAQKWAIHRKKEELKAKGKAPQAHPYQQERDEQVLAALKAGKPLDEPVALTKAKRTRKQVQANAAQAISELAASSDPAQQALAAGLKQHFEDLPPVQSAQERRYNELKSFIAAKKRAQQERAAQAATQQAQVHTKETQATKAEQATKTSPSPGKAAAHNQGKATKQSQAQKWAIHRKKQQPHAQPPKGGTKRPSSSDMER